MLDYSNIDRAAHAGFDAFASGTRMPGWVTKDQVLMDAWNAGKRQAADRASKKPVNATKNAGEASPKGSQPSH